MIPKETLKEELLIEFKILIVVKLEFKLNFTEKEINQRYTIEQLKVTQI